MSEQCVERAGAKRARCDVRLVLVRVVVPPIDGAAAIVRDFAHPIGEVQPTVNRGGEPCARRAE